MEITGKVISVLPSQKGTGGKGPWTKHEFVIETESQYPKKVHLGLFGKGDTTLQVTEGDTIKASINIESREYNSKWYTNVNVYKLEVTAYDRAPKKGSAATSDEDMGWGKTNKSTPPPPVDTTDDLPF